VVSVEEWPVTVGGCTRSVQVKSSVLFVNYEATIGERSEGWESRVSITIID
jgi:hypothetical protein